MIVRTCGNVVAGPVLAEPSQLAQWLVAAVAGTTPVSPDVTIPAATTATPARFVLLSTCRSPPVRRLPFSGNGIGGLPPVRRRTAR
jgi:hypothetical protein